jgi:hypothetical protein
MAEVRPLNSRFAALCACALAAVAQSQPADTPAVIPIEVLAVDPALATGAIASSSWAVKRPTVARQPARAARAVVLTESRKGKVLALALLGRHETTPEGALKLDVAAESQAWCEFGTFMSAYVDCYQDLDADGKFEVQRRGALGSDEAVALRRVQPGKAISPLPYRAATEAETPKFHVGYVSCMSEHNAMPTLDSPLRFGTFINRSDDARMADSGACSDIAKPLGAADHDERLFQFGRFQVAVRAGADGQLTTRLIEGIPAGTLLGHLRSGSPLANATDTSPDISAITGDTPFLRIKGEVQVSQTAKAGEEFFSAQVEHGLTGTLKVELKTRHKKPKVVAAGSPLYGIAMSSNQVARSFDPEIVWCAPLKDEQQKLVARCAVPMYRSSYNFYETDWAPYAVTSAAGESYIDPPVVERGPVSFGAPLFLKLRYQKTEKKYVSIEWSLAPGEERVWKPGQLRRARDDAGFVLLGDVLLKLSPSADGSGVAVHTEIGKFEPDGEIALPLDAARIR